MPKIAAATVAENREQRRGALLTAAATLMRQQGAFTVAEVASEVGLSRSAVYEYYSSAAELIADVLVDEFTAWSQSLGPASAADPRARVRDWIRGVLDYVIDGRHALLRSAGAVEIPEDKRVEVQALHEALIAPLVDALRAAGLPDADRQARFVWGVVSEGINRIEAGAPEPSAETEAVIAFVDGALDSVAAPTP